VVNGGRSSPIVSLSGPLSALPVGSTATITAAFDDAATNDPTRASSAGMTARHAARGVDRTTSCSASRAFTTRGVDTVEVRVIDDEDMGGDLSLVARPAASEATRAGCSPLKGERGLA
jgi:hypothetical protein